jgi:hypothetical protein
MEATPESYLELSTDAEDLEDLGQTKRGEPQT